jgi:hypothetical protein
MTEGVFTSPVPLRVVAMNNSLPCWSTA